MRRILVAGAAVCAVVGVAVAVPSRAETKRAPASHPLPSRVTVVTAGSGTARISLARDLVHRFGSRDVPLRVTGPGRLFGLVLVPHGVGLDRDRPLLVIGNLPLPGRPHPSIILGTDKDLLPDRLPAGSYDLYVVAQGRLSLQLSLPGEPAGAATIVLRPTRQATGEAFADIGSGTSPVVSPTFAAGDTWRSTRGAVLVSFQWKVAAAQTSSIRGACLYPGGASRLQYSVPAAVGGICGELDGLVDVRVPANTLGFSWTHLEPGTWGAKDYFTDASAPRAAGITYLAVTS